MVQEVGLKVSEAFQQDVGHGRARIDHQTRIDLDLSIGDVIEIEGAKTTAAPCSGFFSNPLNCWYFRNY